MSPCTQIVSLYILFKWQVNTVLPLTEVHVNEQLFISVNEMFSPICSKGKVVYIQYAFELGHEHQQIISIDI